MNLHLTNAHTALARGDKAAALAALTNALRMANAANDKTRRSLIMRAMNYARAVKP